MSRRVRFSKLEDDTIWNYVHVDNTDESPNQSGSVKGNSLWKELEKTNIVPNRTWQSLKDRYLKHILPNVKRWKSDPSLWKDGRMTLKKVAKELGLEMESPANKRLKTAAAPEDAKDSSPLMMDVDQELEEGEDSDGLGGLSLLAADSLGSDGLEDVFQITPPEAPEDAVKKEVDLTVIAEEKDGVDVSMKDLPENVLAGEEGAREELDEDMEFLVHGGSRPNPVVKAAIAPRPPKKSDFPAHASEPKQTQHKKRRKTEEAGDTEASLLTPGSIRRISRRFMFTSAPVVQITSVVDGSKVIISDGEFHMQVELCDSQVQAAPGALLALDSLITSRLAGALTTRVTKYTVIEALHADLCSSSRPVSEAAGFIGREGRRPKKAKVVVEATTEPLEFDISQQDVKSDKSGVYYVRMIRNDPNRGPQKVWVELDEEKRQPIIKNSNKGHKNAIFKYSLTQSTAYTSNLGMLAVLPKEEATAGGVVKTKGKTKEERAAALDDAKLLDLKIDKSQVDERRVGVLARFVDQMCQDSPGLSRTAVFHALLVNNGSVAEAKKYLANPGGFASAWTPQEDQAILRGEQHISKRSSKEIEARRDFLGQK